MVKAYSLAQLKHMYITPLQEGWQAIQVIRFCPEMEPVVTAYRKRYPHIAEAVVLSMDERDERFLGDSTLTYGETRWTSFIQVLSQLKLTAQDRFMDLGCGTGFLCMLASQTSGCQAEGHDIIGGFIENANQIVRETSLENVRFFKGDFLQRDLSAATVIYMTCTCFPTEVMQQLSERLKSSSRGTRFVTVTRRLPGDEFRLLHALKLKFSWGTDRVWIQERI